MELIKDWQQFLEFSLIPKISIQFPQGSCANSIDRGWSGWESVLLFKSTKKTVFIRCSFQMLVGSVAGDQGALGNGAAWAP